MADTLQLSYSSTTLNLHAASDAGWRVRDWRPACAADDDEWVWEEMIADVDEESDDALAASVRAMDDMQRYALAYRSDILRTTPVWLTCQMAGETNARRACVREIEMVPQSDMFGAGFAADHRMRFRLRIERRAYWEATSATTLATGSNLSSIGGEFDYTSGADVTGTVPARVYSMSLAASENALTEHIWVGFFDKAKGSWTAKTELESQTLGTDATATSDANASPGSGNSRVTVSFATAADWASRVTGFTIPNPGRQLVLCRAFVDSGTVAEIRMVRNGVYGQIVRVSATAWALHEMEVVTMPPYGRLVYEALAAYTNAVWTTIYARRISGSGNLYLDILGYVPADELLIHLDGAGSSIAQLSTYTSYCNETPDGQRAAVRTDDGATTISKVVSSSWTGRGIPVGDGRLYLFAALVNKASTFTNTIDVGLQLVPRWRLLRGSN